MANHCMLCNKSYVWTQDLKRHMRNKHSMLMENPAQKQQQQQQQKQQEYTQQLQQQKQQEYTQQQQQQQQQQQKQQEYTQQQQQQQQKQQEYTQQQQKQQEYTQQQQQQQQQKQQEYTLQQQQQQKQQEYTQQQQKQQEYTQQQQQQQKQQEYTLQQQQQEYTQQQHQQQEYTMQQQKQHGALPLQEDPLSRIHTIGLQHPFTMMISGPTACGKTTFVKNLLQNHTFRIQPTIQRIVWLYKRWQPLYSVIQRTVFPRVEFVQGIPTDLEDDDFFDHRINNLLILDDLYSEAGKDKRITDLFTEGSHHRSLSVISINQNLFGNKDPTQRRNCHYLILFNNPVDQQSVMTLARQMYPGNTDYFLKAFTKATKHPYGYLLVDLKPFTCEKDRLKNDMAWRDITHTGPKTDLTNQIPESQNRAELTNHVETSLCESIKEGNIRDSDHSSVGFQSVHFEQENTMADKGQACDDCGLLFDSGHDVQRHVKSGWCPENKEPQAKRAKIDEEIMDDDVEDNVGYQHLWHLAQCGSKDKFNKLYDQFMDNGENEDDAEEMASERVQPYREKNFLQRYQSLLEIYWFPLLTNATHHKIVQEINDLRSKGVSLTSAAKRVLKKNKKAFEDLFESKDENESEDDSEEDTASEDSE